MAKYDSLIQKFLLGIKYPSSAYQRLEYFVGDILSKRHKKRIQLYKQFTFEEKIAILKLTGADVTTIDLAYLDFINNTQFSNYVDSLLNFGYELLEDGISAAGDIEPAERRILYVLCKVIKPKIVLETSVANGVSSVFILKALDENKEGLLFSIDLPSVALKTIFHKDSGWIIPEELRYRWHLFLSRSSKLLSSILRKLGRVDIFFHDSNHSYNSMMLEFKTVWPFILDFSERVDRYPIIIKGTNLGGIIK